METLVSFRGKGLLGDACQQFGSDGKQSMLSFREEIILSLRVWERAFFFFFFSCRGTTRTLSFVEVEDERSVLK